MDINKIHDAMKVLKEECKKYKECKDCSFYDIAGGSFKCYLEREPARWEEDKIVENNCTTIHNSCVVKWDGPALRCDDCNEMFMLSALDREHIIGKFCPHCGKKIVNYKEENE